MKNFVKSILNMFWGKAVFQGFFDRLHFFSLRGMNFGGGSYPGQSGEKYVIDFVSKKIQTQQPWVVFDVGANVGDYTSELLTELGSHSYTIYAFEPSAQAFARLSALHGKQSNVKIFNLGLSNESAQQQLFADTAGSGLGSLLHRDVTHLNTSFNHSETVTVTTLDKFCREQNIASIDFLKLDVEGAEMRVLEGARELLAQGKIRFLQFEFGGADIDARVFFRDFYRLLKPRYNLYRVVKDGLCPIDDYRESNEIFITTNYLAELKNFDSRRSLNPTILTRPASVGAAIYDLVRNAIRFIVYRWRGYGASATNIFRYGGHHAVTRSLVVGLEQMGVKFNYNPWRVSQVGQTVVVLSNIAALRQALALKKTGKIKFLVAGPNLMTLPYEHNGILTDSGIDVCLVPSEVIAQVYVQLSPAIAHRVAVWPAGVDPFYWLPQPQHIKNKQIIIYCKSAPSGLVTQSSQLARDLGFQIKEINYGQYSAPEFKTVLQNSMALIFLSESESQGIALVESWAMDVPTLVWDGQLKHPLIPTLATSPAPFLTPHTGLFWKNIEELKTQLVGLADHSFVFSPRSWVLQHMTDRHAAENLLVLLENNKTDHRSK